MILTTSQQRASNLSCAISDNFDTHIDNTVNCEIVLDRAGGSNGMHIGTEILNKSSHMSLKWDFWMISG